MTYLEFVRECAAEELAAAFADESKAEFPWRDLNVVLSTDCHG